MSTLYDLQKEIADACNAEAYLVQGGCVAFAEDEEDIMNKVDTQLAEVAGLSIVVSTPDAKVIGGGNGAIAMEIEELAIRVTETPALSRTSPGNLSALKAAQKIAFLFHQPACALQNIRQTADEHAGTVSVTCTFRTTINLTDPETPQQEPSQQE